MFQSARIQLTTWYVLISMFISILFSTTIFAILHAELTRNEKRIEFRLQRLHQFNQNTLTEHQKDINITENTIKLYLVYVNFVILCITSAAAYFLAGRTLKPIKESMDRQNQFIADASHELRTPLAALQTAIEVHLRDKTLDLMQAKKVLEENLEDVEKLKHLSDNLLRLITLQNTPTTQHEKVLLTPIIKTAISKVQSLAQHKKIKVETFLKNAEVSGDTDKLIELFTIFLDNAIKYSQPEKTITITTKVTNET